MKNKCATFQLLRPLRTHSTAFGVILEAKCFKFGLSGEKGWLVKMEMRPSATWPTSGLGRNGSAWVLVEMGFDEGVWVLVEMSEEKAVGFLGFIDFQRF